MTLILRGQICHQAQCTSMCVVTMSGDKISQMARQDAYLSFNAAECGIIVHASVYLELGVVGAHARVLVLVDDLHSHSARIGGSVTIGKQRQQAGYQ